MKRKEKVLAYIIRERQEAKELLVFLHRDYPEAGLQVPGGTVDPGEDYVEAIIREIEEESGLVIKPSEIMGMIGESFYKRKDIEEINHRHYFLIRKDDLPDSWTHTVHSSGADDGLLFDYFWMEIDRAKNELTGNMGELLK